MPGERNGAPGITTDITVILDRSGSMADIADDVVGGLNTFLASQGHVEGKACFTLVQFDDRYEVVHSHVPIEQVPPLTRETYVPRGSTALLDAIGRTIVETGVRLATTPVADRPQVVIVAVQTDGFENASREFSRQQIVEMIRHQEEKYRWQFVFLAAEQDAIASGEAIGCAPASALGFDKDAVALQGLYAVMASKVTDVRRGRTRRVEFDAKDRRRTKR